MSDSVPTISSSSTPSVELTPVAPSVPVLSATQIQTAVDQIEVLIKGKSLAQVLSALPSVVESTYTLVQSFLQADQSVISNAVLAITVQAVGVSGLASEDVVVLDSVLENCVPAVIALVAKYLPEAEEEVVTCCSGCWKWLSRKF